VAPQLSRARHQHQRGRPRWSCVRLLHARRAGDLIDGACHPLAEFHVVPVNDLIGHSRRRLNGMAADPPQPRRKGGGRVSERQRHAMNPHSAASSCGRMSLDGASPTGLIGPVVPRARASRPGSSHVGRPIMAAKKRVCAQPGCPRLQTEARCREHTRTKDRGRGSRHEREYDSKHVAARNEWVPVVEAGGVECRRASNGTCRAPSPIIQPDEPWDLGHPDRECPAPRAPEHRGCNRATSTRRGFIDN
jgi:hypothetical protein